MVRVKVSPLETAVAVDAASSPSAALPPHARAAPLLHGEQLHWGKKKKTLGVQSLATGLRVAKRAH